MFFGRAIILRPLVALIEYLFDLSDPDNSYEIAFM